MTLHETEDGDAHIVLKIQKNFLDNKIGVGILEVAITIGLYLVNDSALVLEVLSLLGKLLEETGSVFVDADGCEVGDDELIDELGMVLWKALHDLDEDVVALVVHGQFQNVLLLLKRFFDNIIFFLLIHRFDDLLQRVGASSVLRHPDEIFTLKLLQQVNPLVALQHFDQL